MKLRPHMLLRFFQLCWLILRVPPGGEGGHPNTPSGLPGISKAFTAAGTGYTTPLFMQLGRAFRRHGRYVDAAAAFKHGLTAALRERSYPVGLRPTRGEFFYELALTGALLGENARACKHLKAAIKLDAQFLFKARSQDDLAEIRQTAGFEELLQRFAYEDNRKLQLTFRFRAGEFEAFLYNNRRRLGLPQLTRGKRRTGERKRTHHDHNFLMGKPDAGILVQETADGDLQFYKSTADVRPRFEASTGRLDGHFRELSVRLKGRAHEIDPVYAALERYADGKFNRKSADRLRRLADVIRELHNFGSAGDALGRGFEHEFDNIITDAMKKLRRLFAEEPWLGKQLPILAREVDTQDGVNWDTHVDWAERLQPRLERKDRV